MGIINNKTDISKYIINDNSSILSAFEKLNNVPDSLTLFVTDTSGKLVGTLTDGDIRRGFLNGCKLSDKTSNFMSGKYHFLTDLEVAPEKINEIKRKGVQLLPLLNVQGEIIKVFDLNKIITVLPLDCVLMAGGRGERLRPLTDNTPKPLLKVGDKPIIEYNIDHIRAFGVQNFHISVRYLAENIKKELGDGGSKGISIDYIEENSPLGTIGSVSLIKDFKHDTILIMNSDLFTNFDLEEFYLDFIQNGADMMIATVPYNINIPYAVLEGNSKAVTGIKEKPGYTYQSNAGIYLIKRELLEVIPLNKRFDATDLIEASINLGKKIKSFQILGYWIDIGNPEDFKKVQEIVKHVHK